MAYPIRSRLSYPAGIPAGFDRKHAASRNVLFSAVPSATTFVNLLTGVPGTVNGSPAKSIRHIGPAIACPASAYTSFPGQVTTNFPRVTIAAIFESTGGNQDIFSSSYPQFGISIFIQSSQMLMNWWGQADISSGLTLTSGHKYFAAASFDTAANITNWVLVDLGTGQTRTSTTATTSYGGASSGTFTVGVTPNNLYSANTHVAAVMYSSQYMSMAMLRRWAQDPWAFWYPRPELKFRVEGVSATALAAMARIVARGRATPAGTAALAARSTAQAWARPSLTGSTSLSGRSLAAAKVRAPIAGAVAFVARTASAVKARATATGSTALAGRSMAEFVGRAASASTIALLARTVAAVLARAAAPLGKVSITGQTVVRTSGRIVPPGAIALFARALAVFKGRSQAPSGTTTLAGKSLAQARSVLTMTPTAGLSAKSTVSGRGRAVGSFATGLAAVTKIAARAQSSLVAAAVLVGVSAKTSIAVTARATLTGILPMVAVAGSAMARVSGRAAKMFVTSRRVTRTGRSSRTVQVSPSNSRTVQAPPSGD